MGLITVTVIIAVLIIVLFTSVVQKTPSQIGTEGENEVSGILQSLPCIYHEIRNVIIPTKNGTSQIDHVVVSRYGIFVIETKNYSGWIFGSNNSKKWKQTFKTESHYFYNPIKQNWSHVYALSELLKLYKGAFKPVVVFSDKATLNVESTTPVINMCELRNHILSFTQEIFTPEQAKEIYETIKKKQLAGPKIDVAHLQTIKDELEEQRQSIEQGKCPRCNGNLVLRNGKYGLFYACTNYPRCRFTQDI